MHQGVYTFHKVPADLFTCRLHILQSIPSRNILTHRAESCWQLI